MFRKDLLWKVPVVLLGACWICGLLLLFVFFGPAAWGWADYGWEDATYLSLGNIGFTMVMIPSCLFFAALIGGWILALLLDNASTADTKEATPQDIQQ